jgi:ferritin-like metal-binding protein YciE
MALESLQDLFVNELKDIYNGEKQLVAALPRMAKAAQSPQLRDAITKHLRETQGQVQRLESIFESLGKRPQGKRCKGMAGLVEEGKEIMEEEGAEAVLDAALIASAQKVEHYEIATYGCLITYAELLGDANSVKLLKQTLSEEENADKTLTRLGEGGINEAAVAAGQGEEEEGEEG